MSLPCRWLHLDHEAHEGERVRLVLEDEGWAGEVLFERDTAGLERALGMGTWDGVLVGDGIGGMGLEEVLRELQGRLPGVPVVYCAAGDAEGRKRVRGLGGRGLSGVVWKDRLVGLRLVLEGRQAEGRGRHHQILEDLILGLSGTRKLEEGLRMCLEAAIQEEGWDCAGFYLMDEGVAGLTLVEHVGLSSRFVEAVRWYGPESSSLQIVAQGEAVFCRISEIPNSSARPMEEEGMRSLAMVPMKDQGRVLGCLNVGSRTLDTVPKAAQRLVLAIAANAAQAIVRLRAEREREVGQQRLRALFDAIPESLFLMDVQGTILEANLGFASRFGKGVEEVVDRKLFDLIPASLIESRREWMAQVERTRQPVVREEPWGERWLRHHYCPVLGLDGKLEQLVVLAVNITDRRLAEEAVRQSQQLLEGVFNSVVGQIAVVDGRGRILSVNAAWKRFQKEVQEGGNTSVAVGCGVATHYLENLHLGPGEMTEEGRMALEGIRSVIEGRRDYFSLEYPCHTPLERRWFQLTVTPLGQEGGGAVIALINITGRKLAEEELRRRLELQDQLTKVAASVPGLIYSFRLGADGTMSMPFANEALRDLFGLEPEEVRDDFTPGLKVVHPSDLKDLLGSVEASARDVSPWHGVLRVILPGRGERWLEGHSMPRREADGSVIWHGFIQDITQRKRAEQVLAAEVTRRRMLIEGSRDGIVVLNESGGVFEASHRFADMLGYTLEEVRALRVWDWDRNWTEEMVLQAIKTMEPEGHFLETRHWRKDGSSFAVEISNSLAMVDGQRLVFCVCRDVSERKRTEAREARNRLLTEFLLELHQRAPQMNDRDLYDYVLERAVALTQSEIGFFHQVSDDQNTIILTTWNRRAMEQCSAPFESHYPIRQAGSWVDCVRMKQPVVCNDYEHSENRHGLPEGHAVVRRFMSIPVIHEGKARIIFGVGNKEGEYQEEDVAQLQVVANELHKLMIQRGIQNQLRQLSEAVEQSPVGILIAQARGKVEYLNPRYAEASGTERGSLLGGSLGSMLTQHWGLMEGRVEELMRMVREGGSWSGEVRRPGVGGESRWESVALSPITEASGEVTHVLAIREDVTERRRALEALQISEERYRSLVESSSDWVWEVDQESRFTYCSPRIESILGYTPEEVLGRHPFEFMVMEEGGKVQAALAEISAAGKSFTAIEVLGRHRDGGRVMLEITGVPVKGREGQVVGYLGMARDVTARRHLEAQFRQAQKLEAVGHLAGGVAHDFNNILAAIMMNFELLREDASLSSEARENLLELEKEARRAAGVTRQLLMFSRRSVLDVRVLNMNDVVGDILKMLRRLIGEQVELVFRPDKSLPAVEADPGMLEQVVMNLAVNARDAMPRGGRISIVTRGEWVGDERLARYPESRAGWFACLSLADTGCGMEAETLTKIFEPFFTTKEAFRGTGLGLATVHGIVGQHKGWIEVESAPGKGAEFRVYLPAIQRPKARNVSEPRVELSEFRGEETILVVEDEPSVRRSLSQILRTLGYTILEAEDSREALEMWKTKGGGVSLLFTDMVMPGTMNGLELAEHLLGERPDLRVIISSGYSDSISREGMPDDSRIVYLSKPYDLRALGVTLRNSLQSGQCHSGKEGL